jgi:hypothetical protein
MKSHRKYPNRGKIVILTLALIFTSIICIPAATADCLPGYVESITPNTSVTVTISSDGRNDKVVTTTSPSSVATNGADTRLSKAYSNYYLNYYLTPGFVGNPLIGEDRLQSGSVSPAVVGTAGTLSELYERVSGRPSVPSAPINLWDTPEPLFSPPYSPVGEVNYIQGIYPFAGQYYNIAIDETGTSFCMADPVKFLPVNV